MKLPKTTLAALLAAGAACAAPPPRPQAGGPGKPQAPPAAVVPADESLATIYGLTVAQQQQIRSILRQRRDAEQSLHEQMHDEHEALRRKEQSQHDRISDETTRKLRATLGDEGYMAWARWESMRRPPSARLPGPPRRDGSAGAHAGKPPAGAKNVPDGAASTHPG